MRKRTQLYYLPPAVSARDRDAQLVRDALSEEAAAWETLYQEAFAYVASGARQFDLRHFFAADDYEEIAAEALDKAYAHLERYQAIGRFRGWVLGHAKNIMRNRRSRQLTARRNQFLLESIAQSQSREQDPLYILLRLERDRSLWTAFYQLSAVDRTIPRSRVFWNVPPRELAKHLQLTRKEVLRHYEQALLALCWNYCRFYRTAGG